MANNEFTPNALSIEMSSSGQEPNREMTITTSFTIGVETWKITLPGMKHDELRHLVHQFGRAISRDQHAASLAESEEFTSELI